MVVNSTGGTYTLTGDSNLVVVDNSTITVDGNAVITAPLAGTANFTKAGPGTLVLNNSSPSFNGTLSVNAGTLEMQNGPDAGATGYSVGTNGILRLGYSSAPNYGQAIVVNGGGVNSPNGLYLAGEPHSAGTASRQAPYRRPSAVMVPTAAGPRCGPAFPAACLSRLPLPVQRLIPR